MEVIDREISPYIFLFNRMNKIFLLILGKKNNYYLMFKSGEMHFQEHAIRMFSMSRETSSDSTQAVLEDR